MQVLVLVGHGSREPAARQALVQLGEHCAVLLPRIQIAIAELELAPEPLAVQLRTIQKQQPHAFLEIMPVFVGPGVHVQSDIPQAVESLSQIRLHPPLGTWPAWVEVVAGRCQAYADVTAWILWGHGSRLSEFGENLAQQAAAVSQMLAQKPVELAFAVQAPTLLQTATTLVNAGHRSIGIVPCFWSSGALLTTLNNQCEQLIEQHPGLRCTVTDVLLPDPRWPIAIAKRIRASNI